MTKKNIALVMGGYSGEHDISIASGNQVYSELDRQRYNIYRIVVERAGWYWLDDEEHRPIDIATFTLVDNGQTIHFDLAFILIHGNPGENGVLQGYFDILGIPYTSCGFYTSSLTFQKGFCNPVVKSFGLVNVAQSQMLFQEPDEAQLADLLNRLHLPLFVKPAAGGSSVATTKVKTPADLLPAIQLAFTEDHAVLVEECINGREFDCGMMRLPSDTYHRFASFQTNADDHSFSIANSLFGDKLVFPITEIIPKGGHEFFDYAAKYQGYSNEVTPAEVDYNIARHIQTVSAQLYDLLGCNGIVRFDFIYDTSRNQLFFLEANTIPGQSAESIVPKQAKALGITPAELYEIAIQAALETKPSH